MSAIHMLELMASKDTSLDKLLTRIPDVDSAAYIKKEKEIMKIYKSGMRAIKKAAKEETEPTEHQMALGDLNLKEQEYAAVFKFSDGQSCKTALRALSTEWLTPPFGLHGANTWRSHHGGPRGCFLITVDKITKHAVLWAAASNETDLPDDMEGAEDVDEEEEDDEGDRENLEGELGLLIAGAGVSLINLKAMDGAERSTHAAKCSGDRSITAKAVATLADKMGCPAEENTKGKRLEWVFNEYI